MSDEQFCHDCEEEVEPGDERVLWDAGGVGEYPPERVVSHLHCWVGPIERRVDILIKATLNQHGWKGQIFEGKPPDDEWLIESARVSLEREFPHHAVGIWSLRVTRQAHADGYTVVELQREFATGWASTNVDYRLVFV